MWYIAFYWKSQVPKMEIHSFNVHSHPTAVTFMAAQFSKGLIYIWLCRIEKSVGQGGRLTEGDDSWLHMERRAEERFFIFRPPHRLCPQSRLQALYGFVPLLLVFLLQSEERRSLTKRRWNHIKTLILRLNLKQQSYIYWFSTWSHGNFIVEKFI